jgi:hypothetical protein
MELNGELRMVRLEAHDNGSSSTNTHTRISLDMLDYFFLKFDHLPIIPNGSPESIFV